MRICCQHAEHIHSRPNWNVCVFVHACVRKRGGGGMISRCLLGTLTSWFPSPTGKFWVKISRPGDSIFSLPLFIKDSLRIWAMGGGGRKLCEIWSAGSGKIVIYDSEKTWNVQQSQNVIFGVQLTFRSLYTILDKLSYNVIPYFNLEWCRVECLVYQNYTPEI